jgi:tetratricopeptide (TPR) repeat protein
MFALLVAGVPALGEAQAQRTANSDDAARRLFQAGKAAFDAGDFEQALRYFERSFESSHRPQLKYNIGLAADRLRQDDKALAAFNTYLQQVPDAENRAEVEARIRALEKAKAERAAAAAPSPEQTASTMQVPQHDAGLATGNETQAAAPDLPLTSQWWFWTGVGAVVLTGTIVAIAAASAGDRQAAPIDSRSGITIMALETR